MLPTTTHTSPGLDQTWHPNTRSSANPHQLSNSLAYPRAISTGCQSARRYAGKPCHFTFNTKLVGIELTDLALNGLLQPIALFFVSFLIPYQLTLRNDKLMPTISPV